MTVGIDSSNLRAILEPWTRGRGYVIELATRTGRRLGNNGDMLMHGVFESLMSDFKMRLLPDEQAAYADYLVVPPNGALLDSYHAPRLLTERLAALPDQPLLIFPSSARFNTVDPATMFAGRTSPVLWILRERESFDHLARRWGGSLAASGVTLALDHDVVVSGQHHAIRIIREAGGPVSDREALLVARLGIESTDMLAQPVERERPSRLKSVAVAAYQHLPTPVAVPVRRWRTKARQDAANDALLKSLPDDLSAEIASRPFRHPILDVSDPTLCNFSEYALAVATSGLVVTNRLHVAIPATLLGHRVILVDSGYHKLRGVYENSLAGADNVTFVRRHA